MGWRHVGAPVDKKGLIPVKIGCGVLLVALLAMGLLPCAILHRGHLARRDDLASCQAALRRIFKSLDL